MQKETLKWYRLDNSAKIYPIVTTRKTQSLFRAGAEMNEKVDKEILLKAIGLTLTRYPTFKVRLRKGFFWYYLEENLLPPVVHEDDGFILKKVIDRDNNRYLFKVSFFEKRINIDFFHALSDGTGACEFFKTLLLEYLKLKGYPVEAEGVIKEVGEEIPESETEDSYLKYYKKKKITEINVKELSGGGAAAFDGASLFQSGYGLIEGTVDSSKLYQLAKSYNTSVGTLLTALSLLSIYQAKIKKNPRKPLLAFVPVNLRKIFPSETVRNFTLFIRPKIYTNEGENTLESYIERLNPQMKSFVSPEKLSSVISASVKFEKNFFIRLLPLPFKYLLLKIGKNIFLTARQTIILSNIGNIAMPQSTKPYIDKIFINLNVNRLTPMNLGVCSYNDKCVLSFTRGIVDTEIERVFFSTLSELGLNVKINSNRWEE